ncbi:MAG: tRNA 2-thiouridine(34) synthase MnmA, partial [Anaeroplasmataceae bacterium]
YLLKGIDNNKDQTYFLMMLTQEQLKKSLFPIGDMVKADVRKLASEYELSTSTKKDSTGICFIGERNFKEFLKNYIPSKPGKMKTLDGKVIGNHDGLMYHTIGQRKGLGIGGLDGYNKEPWFTIGKDIINNVLLVGQGIDNPYLFSDKCTATDLNWISYKPIENKNYMAKFRYRQEDIEVGITFKDDFMIVNYPSLVRAVTPGQAVVIYDGDICLGGGIIDKVYMKDEERKY